MSDTHEPPQPDGSADEPVAPPPSGSPPPTPPPPPPPAAGEGPYAAAPGTDPYGTGPAGAPAGGGYGTPPPPSDPYAQAAYGQDAYAQGPAVPGPNGVYTIGSAFNYGWSKFQANLGPILIGVIGIVVVLAVLQIIGLIAVGGLTSPRHLNCNQATGDCQLVGGGFSVAALFVWFILTLAGWLVALVIAAGVVRAALAITHGRRIDAQTIFSTEDLGQIVLAALIVGVAVTVGLFLCVIPGVIIAFFAQYTLFFLIDRHLPAMDAIRASFSFVNNSLGTLVGFYLASLLAIAIGFAVCYVGSLVAIPVVIIAAAFTYRRLQGEPVAA
jgi:uncharacterized membrane protein